MTFSFCVTGPEYWIEMHISAYFCLPIFHRKHIIAVLKIYTFGLENTGLKNQGCIDIDFLKNIRQLDNKVRNIGIVFFYIHVSTEHRAGSDRVHLEF